jgi:RND superfamily putative drug exporter
VLERWTRGVIRWRLAAIGCWIALAVLGGLCSAGLPSLLSTSLTVPSTSSAQANAILTGHFGENIEGTFTVVLASPGTNPSPGALDQLNERLRAAARVVPGSRVTSLRPAAGILYGNVATSLDLQQAARFTGPLRRALRAAGISGALVTGAPALQSDITPILTDDLHRGELFALLVALLVLLAVLGPSASLLVPFIVAACTMSTSLIVIYLLAHRFLMVLYVPNVVELIGLGLAIDYSLLIVHRYREELTDDGVPVPDAIVGTMASAGRTVLVSGVAVALGLSALLLVPVPFVRSLGFAGLVVPLVSMAAAVTLQPALLSLLGRRAQAATSRATSDRARGGARAIWPRLGRAVTRRPVAVATCSVLVLVIAATSIAWLQLTPGSVTAIPQDIGAAKGLALLRSRGGPGIITPVEIVVATKAPGGAMRPSVYAATIRLATALSEDPEAFIVSVGTVPPYVDPSQRYGQIVVIGRHDFGDRQSQELVDRIRSTEIPAARFPAGVVVSVGGAPAQGVDFLNRVYGSLPWIIALVLALAYLWLLRAFRSLLLPLMAVLLDLLSVAAAYGLLVVVFRFGVGADVFGLYRVSQIEGWVPVFLFAMLFGLSMDYEVFFVSRMRESWDAGMDTKDSITDGLAHTGRVVSAAALIMVGALLGLVFGRIAGLQELGVGLALGVLLDATVVRGLLMPSLMALCGRWNWWLPVPVARVMLTRPSPLAERGAMAEEP